VLESFDALVKNVANSYRFQEECDTLTLRLSKHKGDIKLAEFKAVMLASLRSLVPNDWNSEHEVAWTWLWENVERMLKAVLGKPPIQQRALEKFFAGLHDAEKHTLRREVYAKFFALAPSGQEFFKQSTTRLHFIADKIVEMTLDMYIKPRRMSEDISALGLRHVGYGSPTEFFGPFVTACVGAVRKMTNDEDAEEGFRWSLGLISRILVRTILEGSTIVMKAINANSEKSLKKAVQCAPRGKRAEWLLKVQVGTQAISPLYWAIESGSLEAASAMLEDLVVIRADRDRYYYGVDDLFARHPDVIKRLVLDAPNLLKVLLDGLVWRSRLAENGRRRVNYYVKHLIVAPEGHFSPALAYIGRSLDPAIACHPVIVIVADLVWTRVAHYTFLFGKGWFVLTLVVFVICQSVLPYHSQKDETGLRIALFCGRCFIYMLSLGAMVYSHITKTASAIRSKEVLRVCGVHIPEYLLQWQEAMSFMLMTLLILMLTTEPILRCIHREPLFGQGCCEQHVLEAYSIFSSVAVLCYCTLMLDMTVLSTKLSAFALVCSNVLGEVALSLSALFCVTLAFSVSMSALQHNNADFSDFSTGMVSSVSIVLGMFPDEKFVTLHEDPALLIGTICHVLVTIIFILNLLVAQLSCSYKSKYHNMVGSARLNRINVINELMPMVSQGRWQTFVNNLNLDTRLEFNEGDVGIAGGIQVFEPASVHMGIRETIRRFGGSTQPNAPWPAENSNVEEDRFARLEKILGKATSRMARRHKKGSNYGSSSGSGMGSKDKSKSNSSSGASSAAYSESCLI